VRDNRDDESSLEGRNAVASAGHADRSIDEKRCAFVNGFSDSCVSSLLRRTLSMLRDTVEPELLMEVASTHLHVRGLWSRVQRNARLAMDTRRTVARAHALEGGAALPCATTLVAPL